jgi:3-deoxy-D-manno-octulosonic-acid transferase
MWRHLYSIILILCVPALIWHVVRKYGRENQPSDIPGRLGLATPQMPTGAIWLHACSLGEAKVALALVKELETQDPTLQFFLTATTPSGLDVLRSGSYPVMVFPWDLPWIWRRWLDALQPRAVVVVETELWPNLIATCRTRGVPVVLANGRLSEKSARRYSRFAGLSRPMWAALTRALMQDSEDAIRAHALGAALGALSEVGSVKLDQPPLHTDADLLNRLIEWKGERPLICLMSGHPGEEALLFGCVEIGYRVLLVPRHPIRGPSLQEDATAHRLISACVSAHNFDNSVDVLIGDTFGDMGAYLQASDVVVIGGSFSGRGGQNPIEPALLGKALVAGPSMYNFARITEALKAHGGLLQAAPQNLEHALAEALSSGQQMGDHARGWVLANQGSTARQAMAIRSILTPITVD